MTPSAPRVPSFTLPKVQFSSPGNGGNLSDLVKLRLEHEAKQSESTTAVGIGEVVTKEDMKAQSSGLSIRPESTPLATSLASLSIGKASTVATESPGKAFSNLSELAKHHLQSQGTPPTFPSASTSTAPGSGAGTVPTLFKIPLGFGTVSPLVAREDDAGGKSGETKQSLAGNGWILDLKSALIKNKKDILVPSAGKQEKKGEHIQYGFIDCDLKEAIKPIIDEFCTIDASSVLEMDLTKHRTLQASALGAVLSVRYRKRKLPTEVLHQFRPNTTVVPFRFDGPSPDDVVLGHIKKNRR
uniref:Uncharacterized protein n=1 Tax=Anopheles marajoara TaxID=58244 RepID=A0A2M4BVR7_9DIPT